MHILVTGGAGFIGANFIARALERGFEVTNLDALTYAGNIRNLEEHQGNPSYHFLHGDICDSPLVERTLQERRIDSIVNFAAESHVDRSIGEALPFARTNVTGTVTLLEAAYRAKTDVFIQISTDEVYGSLDSTGKFSLDSPIKPSSPYSASKAAADHFALAFHHTHGMDVRVTRCTNNFGRFQHPEKFIPTIIRSALHNRTIPVYGDGHYVRDWIYVDDHVEGVLRTLELGKGGSTYLFGGSQEIENNALVAIVLDVVARQSGRSLESLCALVQHVTDRPGHDRRYAIDYTRSSEELQWTPSTDFESAIEQTVAWYIEHEDWWG